ncbi:MAG TPA: hypothetical protein VHB98_18500 [Chloroflexota bacterium]|nr:hypothetical protein [Chloroflexota bacterium]
MAQRYQCAPKLRTVQQEEAELLLLLREVAERQAAHPAHFGSRVSRP